MNDQTDTQLLRAYAENRSEAAFAELVRRHVDFVYSAARRMVCDPHLAEDVTQGVFVAFARNARQLSDRTVLSGWLHRTAQNIAAQTVRTIERRRAREQEAVAMNELLAHESDVTWENIEPHLDAALGELSEPDRDALLLRYFERKSAREMALTLNVSEDAAQKRVSRAVERLREFFSKRKVTVGASGLVVLISANAVQAAPIGLFAMISSAVSLVGTASQTSTAVAATKTIAMNTLQRTLIAATITVAVGTGIYEARHASNLQKQIQTLRQEQLPLSGQTQKWQREHEDYAQQLAALREENERLNRSTSELIKLRGEIGVLRQSKETASIRSQTNELSASSQYQKHQVAIKEMQDVALGLRFCAQENNWQYPTNFDQLKSSLKAIGKDWLLSTNHFLEPELRKGHLQLDAFEFVSRESFSKPFGKMPVGLILREENPYQTPDGKWERMYGFAEGTAEKVISEDGNFEVWEAEHLLKSPP